jgi:tRNA G18 (ribose-2'-O)-methylase SpoU
LGIQADSLYEAAQQSIADPTLGYDGRFGKSAIRTYRSFLYPKQKGGDVIMGDDDNDRLAGMALRTAQQIAFLRKRHQSHQETWVRHHDGGAALGSDDAARNTITTTPAFPLMLLLDNLRSAFNVGSLLRTADATACTQVITCGITPHPNGGSGADKVAKAALGADRVVPSRHFRTTREAVAYLRSDYPAYRLIGLETTERSLSYTHVTYPREGVVLVLGNEVTGLDTEIMPLLDELVEIPMFGTKNSLNVASCAPIVLYEIVRQWGVTHASK